MTDRRTLRNNWKMWANGLIHSLWSALATALGSGAVLGPVHALGGINDKTMWIAWGSAILSALFNAFFGYIKQTPPPDVFAVTQTLTIQQDTADMHTVVQQETTTPQQEQP